MRRLPKAFSLLEVLIAASLLAIIGALLMQSLSSSLDAKDAIETTSNRYHVVRAAMSRVVDEVSMAYLSSHRPQNGGELRAITGFRGERDRIDFTALGYVARVEDEKKSDQRQLSYFIDTDPRSRTQSLMRREQANLDDDFEEGGRTLTLLPDVRSVEFQYWDPQKDAWAEKWDAAGSELNRLPSRIRIELVAVMDNGEEQTFVTQSKLWMLVPLTL
jgi:prepilin-type N-terminal cleavage/methylation domain-containing protein